MQKENFDHSCQHHFPKGVTFTENDGKYKEQMVNESYPESYRQGCKRTVELV